MLIAPSSIMLGLFMFTALLFVLNKDKLAKPLLYFTTIIFLFVGTTGFADILFSKWERQFPLLNSIDKDYEGIIVLGGGVDVRYSSLQKRIVLNAFNGDRVTEMVSLLKRHPELKLIYTGGNGYLFNDGEAHSEAEVVEKYIENMLKRKPNQYFFEKQSKNTYQNAALTLKLYKEVDQDAVKNKNWLLVTSAYHMPRSHAVFQKQGWHVTAYPTSYLTYTDKLFSLSPKFWVQWGKIDILARELIGMIAYKLTDKL